jgi:hypothetical protein
MLQEPSPERGTGSDKATPRRRSSLLDCDEELVRAHVAMVHGLAAGIDGLIIVAAFGENPGERFDLKRKLPPIIQRFRVGDVDGTVQAVMGLARQPHMNAYMPLAVMRPSLEANKKGEEADVVAALGLVLDSDDDANRPTRPPLEPNYVLETSSCPARNLQPFFLLDRPLPASEAKQLAIALRMASGGDSGAVDVSHVWRIAGTANWPNAKKVHQRGRPREPQLVLVRKPFDGTLISVDALRGVLEPQLRASAAGPKSNGANGASGHLADAPVAELMKGFPIGLRKTITAPPSPGEDRSRTFYAAVAQMGRRKLSAEAIGAIISAHPQGIGAKFVDRTDLDREIARVLTKTAEPEQTGAGSWRSMLQRNAVGGFRANLFNALMALRHAPDWAGALRYDSFALALQLDGAPPWYAGIEWAPRPWLPLDVTLATEWFQANSINIGPDITRMAVDAVAQERPFHPIREYLSGLTWDRRPRVARWLTTYIGAEPSPYATAIGQCFLISAVARTSVAGCKVDHMLMLEGAQGDNKSKAVRALGGPWFSEDLPDIESKDAALALNGKWIFEVQELDALTRAHSRRIKTFVSKQTDRYRPPYGHEVVEVPRQCVFIGTTNEDSYLIDPTGGRRFWPVRVGSIDVDGIERDRDQLWAEALHLYQAGEIWWLIDPDLIELARDEQRDRRVEVPWEEEVANFVHFRSSISVSEILSECICKPKPQWEQRDFNRIAEILKGLGWEKYRSKSREAGEIKRPNRYRPPGSDP